MTLLAATGARGHDTTQTVVLQATRENGYRLRDENDDYDDCDDCGALRDRAAKEQSPRGRETRQHAADTDDRDTVERETGEAGSKARPDRDTEQTQEADASDRRNGAEEENSTANSEKSKTAGDWAHQRRRRHNQLMASGHTGTDSGCRRTNKTQPEAQLERAVPRIAERPLRRDGSPFGGICGAASNDQQASQ